MRANLKYPFWGLLMVLGLLTSACKELPRANSTRDAAAESDAPLRDAVAADFGPPIPGLGVSRAALMDFLDGRAGVLVWIEGPEWTPKLLDFREENPQVQAIAGENGWQNPILSPDGTRIVYADMMPGPRTIYVKATAGGEPQRIAAGDVGFWQVDNDAGEYIISCDESSKHANGADGKTYRQKLVTGGVALDGETEEVHERAMDAGPNGAGTWLGQVYNNLVAYNRDTQKEYLTDAFWLMDGTPGNHQSCNGSMAPDGSARLMSLVIPHDFVRIYTYSATNDRFEETSRFLLPDGLAAWEYPEWSTHPDFFTAVLMKSDRKHRLVIGKVQAGSAVPATLEVTAEPQSAPDGITYSHLFVE